MSEKTRNIGIGEDRKEVREEDQVDQNARERGVSLDTKQIVVHPCSSGFILRFILFLLESQI